MKTKKYFIEVEMCESTMIAKMEITRKEYERQFTALCNFCEDKETEYIGEIRHYHHEYPNAVETSTFFSRGCCDTILTKLECKDGYCFK